MIRMMKVTTQTVARIGSQTRMPATRYRLMLIRLPPAGKSHFFRLGAGRALRAAAVRPLAATGTRGMDLPALESPRLRLSRRPAAFRAAGLPRLRSELPPASALAPLGSAAVAAAGFASVLAAVGFASALRGSAVDSFGPLAVSSL